MGEHDDDLELDPATEPESVAAAITTGLRQIAAAVERGFAEVAAAIASAHVERHAPHKR
jgi:hypothetical protein